MRERAVRVEGLLNHLGINRAHVLACMSSDWGELLEAGAARIASLTVVAPHLNKGIPSGIKRFARPALVVSGDQGAPAERARSLAASFSRGELVQLKDYSSPIWADTVADRTEEVKSAVLDFVERAEREEALSPVQIPECEGDWDGMRYQTRGRGVPIVLFPLSLAPSQWGALATELSHRYCVVSLGGAWLGPVALLESRARSGYGELVMRLLDEAEIKPGESILEVGCGSGAICRAIAERTTPSTRIIGTDINAYLLSEAKALAKSHGLQERLAFERMDAHDLGYPDGSLDVAVSCTVLEEGNADRMLRELARVTRPGGRVVVVTRAVDVAWCVNIPAPKDLQTRLNLAGPDTGGGVGAEGCADGSLYARAVKAGLKGVSVGPRFAVYRQGERLDDVMSRLLATLSGEQLTICRDIAALAAREGTIFVAEPFHCFLGEK
jgi:SAM-dependent methyltransferase